MEYIKIKNRGELDPRLISLIGGTTKSSDQYKIGRFGTGLKYCLAYLIRNNIDFHIFPGSEKSKITYKKETISETEFRIIQINDVSTSVTDQMGIDFLAWQVIREIYSNALDEGGYSVDIVESDEIQGEEGYTSFYIQLNQDFKDVWDNWDKYFIQNRKPMCETDSFAVYPSTDKLRLYKQGILIYEDKYYSSIFDYDFKNADINEIREYKGLKDLDIYNVLSSLDKNNIDYFLNNINDEHYESTMDYSWSFKNFNDNWKETIGEAKIITKEQKDKLKGKNTNVDLSHTVEVPDNLYKALNKQFEGISALRVASENNSFYEIYSEKLEQKIKKVLAILESCDYSIHPELKFIYGVFGSPNTRAQIKFEDKEILLSEELLECSLFDVCAVLIEENEHFKTNYSDETREFQQHFINLFTKMLFDKHQIEL